MVQKTIYKILMLTFVVSSVVAGCGNSNKVWSMNRASVSMLSLTSTLRIENTSTSSKSSASHSESLNDQGLWKTNDNKEVWKMATSSYSATDNLVTVSYHDNSTEEDHGFSLVYPKVFKEYYSSAAIYYASASFSLENTLDSQNILSVDLTAKYDNHHTGCILAGEEMGGNTLLAPPDRVTGVTKLGNTLFGYEFISPAIIAKQLRAAPASRFYETGTHTICYEIIVNDDQDGYQKQRDAILKTFKSF